MDEILKNLPIQPIKPDEWDDYIIRREDIPTDNDEWANRYVGRPLGWVVPVVRFDTTCNRKNAPKELIYWEVMLAKWGLSDALREVWRLEKSAAAYRKALDGIQRSDTYWRGDSKLRQIAEDVKGLLSEEMTKLEEAREGAANWTTKESMNELL